jgi:ubiquinone/menaquinone biosynthesis C-methylase UbiE
MNKNEKYSIENYDRIAAKYDKSFDGRFTARFKKTMLGLCSVKDGDTVLDVGCGNGSLIGEISRKAEIKAYGVDISANMIEECKRLNANITFSVSGGEKLDFSDNSFDIVTMCCVLHHLDNPQNFFEEARRILKTDGKLIIGEPWFPSPFRQFVDYVLSPLLKAGDNKIFSHKRFKELFSDSCFRLESVYKKGIMQIITGARE